MATRVAIGFRAGCHHAKGKCGIKQKEQNKKDTKYYITSNTDTKT